MKLKMVGYFKENCSQIFVTFEYQEIQFDMYKDLKSSYPQWEFLEDEGFDKLNKIANIDLIEKSCSSHLRLFDFQMS